MTQINQVKSTHVITVHFEKLCFTCQEPTFQFPIALAGSRLGPGTSQFSVGLKTPWENNMWIAGLGEGAFKTSIVYSIYLWNR